MQKDNNFNPRKDLSGISFESIFRKHDGAPEKCIIDIWKIIKNTTNFSLIRIFDPYFTTKQTGSGPGLSVCHSIINRHEGKMYVQSEIGKGTTFTLLLPATTKEITNETEKDHRAIKKLKVLIMDDDEEIRDIFSSMVLALGHTVSVSKEGGEAIAMYKEAKKHGQVYDIIFMDLTIRGGMGGKETVKKLREYDPYIKVIVSSGYADSTIAGYKEDGFDGMLKKPFTKDELNKVIFEIWNK